MPSHPSSAVEAPTAADDAAAKRTTPWLRWTQVLQPLPRPPEPTDHLWPPRQWASIGPTMVSVTTKTRWARTTVPFLLLELQPAFRRHLSYSPLESDGRLTSGRHIRTGPRPTLDRGPERLLTLSVFGRLRVHIELPGDLNEPAVRTLPCQPPISNQPTRTLLQLGWLLLRCLRHDVHPSRTDQRLYQTQAGSVGVGLLAREVRAARQDPVGTTMANGSPGPAKC